MTDTGAKDYDLGPLPHFASAWAHGVIGPGVALATRDGRLNGNAYVNGSALGVRGAFEVITEAGNTMVLTKAEIDERFYPPQWVLKHKHFNAEKSGELGSPFEPETNAQFSEPASPSQVAAVSTAISLKRIADALHYQPAGENIYDLLNDIRHNTRGSP